MIREQLLANVAQAAARFEPAMVVVPPCCNHPDVGPEIERRVRGTLGQSTALASVTVDTCESEEQFFSIVKSQLLQGREALQALWRDAEDADLPAQMKFKALGGVLAQAGWRGLVIIRKFESLFFKMSPTLLAALRDMEAESQIVCINVTSLDYTELGEIRRLTEPSFVSDYGQGHPLHVVGPWTRDEARHHWRGRLADLAPPDGAGEVAAPGTTRGASEEDYFEVAFELSGGIPDAMHLAEGLARQHRAPALGATALAGDIRPFRADLVEQAADKLVRLLDDRRDKEALCRNLVDVDRGGGRAAESLAVLRSHPWAKVLLNDFEDGVRSPAIARAARRRRGGPPGGLQRARSLYRDGEYRLAIQACTPEEKRLRLLAEAMDLVFPDGSRDLYFQPTTQWAKVSEKLGEAASELGRAEARAEARAEVEHWLRVAEAFRRSGKGLDLEAIHGAERIDTSTVEDGLILLGTRVHATIRDRNSITATHVAIPLLEDILRHYLVLVERVPARGAAFDRLPQEAVHRWWGAGDPFVAPPASARLAGTALAVAAAVASEAAARPLFDSREELQEVTNAMGATRNAVGHKVLQPRVRDAQRLSSPAVRLLTKLANAAGASPTPDELLRWLAPPEQAFEP